MGPIVYPFLVTRPNKYPHRIPSDVGEAAGVSCSGLGAVESDGAVSSELQLYVEERISTLRGTHDYYYHSKTPIWR